MLDSFTRRTYRRDLLCSESLECFSDQVWLSSDHRLPTLSVHDVRRVSVLMKTNRIVSEKSRVTQGQNGNDSRGEEGGGEHRERE